MLQFAGGVTADQLTPIALDDVAVAAFVDNDVLEPGISIQRFPVQNSQIAKALARNVRRLRKLKGWTQDELAAKLRIEQTAVSLIENGRSNPTLQTLEAIAACLDVRFAELFDARPPK